MSLSMELVAYAPVTTSTCDSNNYYDYCLCGCETWPYFQGITLIISIWEQSVSGNILT
jgi:hypothetical protein